MLYCIYKDFFKFSACVLRLAAGHCADSDRMQITDLPSAVISSTAQTAYASPDSFPPAGKTAVLSIAVYIPYTAAQAHSLHQFMIPAAFNAPNPTGFYELRISDALSPLLFSVRVCIGQPDDKGFIAYEI